jgi:hypothetical protein
MASSIVVRLRSSRSSHPSQAAELANLARRFGLRIEPQFPNASDPELARWYVATGTQIVDLETAAGVLRELSEVEAAYVQPDPSPAGPQSQPP